MNNILVLTDEANDAKLSDLAYQFAYQHGNDLTIAYTYNARRVGSLAGKTSSATREVFTHESLLQDIGDNTNLVRVNALNVERFTESELAVYAWKKGFSLVIARSGPSHLDMQLLLNKLHCPLMLVPEALTALTTDRIVYLTDLRYCQQPILSNLAKIKRHSLLIAHVCQQGLPDLTLDHGKELFADTVAYHKAYPELFFSHIPEKNFRHIAETLTNTMRADMLVCQNRQYHFQKLLGDRLPERLPAHVSVPVMIFPC